MYVSPSTIIKILTNVPLDNTYEHSIYFTSLGNQSSYFAGKAKYSLTEQSYQRVQKGRIRVGLTADQLYDCNYLMFQNSGFGNKWFYAFIKGVEYINNAVSEIEFEIDVIQTWFFDFSFNKCFVERIHSASDRVGENIIPENLSLGDYNLTNRQYMDIEPAYVIRATCDGHYQDLIMSGYNINGKEIINGLWTKSGLTGEEVRHWLTGSGIDGSMNPTAQNVAVVENSLHSITIEGATQSNTHTYAPPVITDYQPRNKKLLTYPYTMILADNGDGGQAIYRYEDFSTSVPAFTVACDMSGGSPAMLIPQNYKKSSMNYAESLQFVNFPSVGTHTSYYDQWLASTKTSKIPSALSNAAVGVAGGALAGASAGPAGAVAGAVLGAGLSLTKSLIGTAIEGSEAQLQGGQVRTQQKGVISYWLGILGFNLYNKCIKPQIARTIDDFFDKFGYQTNRLMTPRLNVRPYWTYVKTVSCTIRGSVPADDMSTICHIFDNGVTFWTSGDNVGNYSLDNSI